MANIEKSIIGKLVRDAMFYGYVTALINATPKTINEITEEFCEYFYPDEDPESIIRSYYHFIHKLKK